MPVVVVPTTPAVAGGGTTLHTYWQLLAEQLGTYAEYATSTLATSGEASRLLLVNELRDDEEARDTWGGGYVYPIGDANVVPQAGQQRRVLKQGYHGPLGGLLLARPWASAIAAGTTVALSEPLPVREYLGVKGLVDCVREALARIWISARLTLTGEGDDQIDLAAYPWLHLGELQTRGISDTVLVSPGFAPQPSPYGSRIVTDGTTRTLVVDYPYTTADTLYLDVLVRADVLTYDGAAWSYSTTGLVDDDDQGAAPPEWVTAFGMRQALRELVKMTLRDLKRGRIGKDEALLLIQGPGGLAQRLREWSRTCAKIQADEFPQPVPQPHDSFLDAPYETIGWTG